MLEYPSVDSSAAAVNIATVKRYAPPNQRYEELVGCLYLSYESVAWQTQVRRRALEYDVVYLTSRIVHPIQDRLERASTYSNDGERNHVSSTKANSMVDHGGAGVNKLSGESHRSRLIPLHGCSNSEAFQLLNNRWTAAMSAYNNLPEDSVERPVLYTKKSASA